MSETAPEKLAAALEYLRNKLENGALKPELPAPLRGALAKALGQSQFVISEDLPSALGLSPAEMGGPQERNLAAYLCFAKAGRYDAALTYAGGVTRWYHEEATHKIMLACEAMIAHAARGDDFIFRSQGGAAETIFCVSYPRSGNTRFTNLLEGVFPGARHSVFWRDGRYFSPTAQTPMQAAPLFVKDHVLRPEYANNPTLYIVRDFRNMALSLADFLFRETKNPAFAADFTAVVKHLSQTYRFGSWTQSVYAALERAKHDDKIRILRFEDLVGPNQHHVAQEALEGFGLTLSEAAYEKGLEHASAQEKWLREKIPAWSKADIYPEGSFLKRWRAATGPDKWREVMTAQDKQVVHEAGVTDLLLELGLEADPNWWRA